MKAHGSKLIAHSLNQKSTNLSVGADHKSPSMFKNFFKIAWRNLVKSKGYSAINIGGLAVGMAVAILIGLWVYDELSFDKYHANYERIAQVMQHANFNGEIGTQTRYVCFGIRPVLCLLVCLFLRS